MTKIVRMGVSQWETFVSFLFFFFLFLFICVGRPGRRSLGKKSTPSELCSFSNTSRTKLSDHFHFHSKQSSLRDLRSFFSFPSLGEKPSNRVLSMIDPFENCATIIASPPRCSHVPHHYHTPSPKVNFLYGFFLFLFGSSRLSLPFNFLSLCLLFSINLSFHALN
jgi:hypothetical protein